jgi:hypothetical protein
MCSKTQLLGCGNSCNKHQYHNFHTTKICIPPKLQVNSKHCHVIPEKSAVQKLFSNNDEHKKINVTVSALW